MDDEVRRSAVRFVQVKPVLIVVGLRDIELQASRFAPGAIGVGVAGGDEGLAVLWQDVDGHRDDVGHEGQTVRAARAWRMGTGSSILERVAQAIATWV